ncbi:MAG: molybdate ABC transporter permease subunit [Proteobacteria bacterium]|nr:molybdate ABC transporter permease subunit [Pseudomonadota bacterium]
MDWQPILLSMELALVTTVLLLVLATPVAYVLAFYKFRGRSLVEAVFALPIVLPPTVLGFFVLIAVGNHSPFGQAFNAVFGHGLAFTFTGIVIASILYSFPFAVQPIQNAFIAIDPKLIETSRTLGCGAWQSFWRVILPSARVGIITGAMLSFAHTVGEFGVVLMVGGSIPGETKVASIAIYESVEILDYSQAAVMSLIMLSFSFVVMSIVYYYNRSSRSVGFA